MAISLDAFVEDLTSVATATCCQQIVPIKRLRIDKR